MEGSKVLRAICLLLAWLAAASCQAKELLIAFGKDRPPYVYDEDKRGLEIDIVRAALQPKGYTIRVIHVSNRRLQVAINAMGMDGSATVREAHDGTYYSDNYITFENFAISKKQDGLVIQSVADLKGKSIVAWQNAYRDLGPEFEAMFNPKAQTASRRQYFELPSQMAQNKMFWAGRAQVIIIDKTIFLWYRKTLAGAMDTSAEVVFHNIFLERTSFRVAFKNAKVRDDFNEGLRHLRSSGIYQQLYERYIK